MTTSGFTHSDSHLDQEQIKNKENAKDIEMCIDRLSKKTENLTGELTDVLIDNKEKIDIIEELNIES